MRHFGLLNIIPFLLSNHPQCMYDFLHTQGLRISESNEGERRPRGLKSVRGHSGGEKILSVPVDYAITPKTIVENNDDISRIARRCNLTITQILALGILSRPDATSLDYVDICLPRAQCSLSLMPEELWTCLCPAYRRLADRIRNDNLQLYHDIFSTESNSPSRTKFLWALACAESRSFAVEDGGWRVMLPGIELINHRHGVNSDLRRVGGRDDGAYELRLPDTTVAPGEEIFFSYGDDADNLTLLVNFGFCVVNNPMRVVSFDIEDILSAAQSLLPNIYPDAIVQRFRGLLISENKLSPNMLFACDCGKGPRESLKKALTTVRQLGEALLSPGPSLPEFEDSLMRRLLEQRREELRFCLYRIESLSNRKTEKLEEQSKAKDYDQNAYLTSLEALTVDELKSITMMKQSNFEICSKQREK